MHKLNNIRLIQISDCHLSKDKQQQWCGRFPADTLEPIINFINDNESNAHSILATGDLSHDGSQESYAALSSYFCALKKPVYSLAGNHDHLENMAVHLNQKPLSTASHFIEGNWLVILLNTHVTNEEYGHLSKKELSLIDTLLSKHKDKYALIAMHHPPIHVGCAWIDKINLRNSHDFFDIIDPYDHVRAITFGHIHQDTQTLINQVHYLSCPSTCHQYKPNSDGFSFDDTAPGYRWIELHADGQFSTGVKRVALEETNHAS